MSRMRPAALLAMAAEEPSVSASTRISMPSATAGGTIMRASCPPPITPTFIQILRFPAERSQRFDLPTSGGDVRQDRGG